MGREYRVNIAEEIDFPQIGVIGHRIRNLQHFQKGKLVEDLPKRNSKKLAHLDCLMWQVPTTDQKGNSSLLFGQTQSIVIRLTD